MKSRPFGLDDLYNLAVPSDPQFAPDGSAYAFVLTQADRDIDLRASSIWIGTFDGDRRQLTAGPSDSAPRFSPDGSRLAYLGLDADGRAQVYVVTLEPGAAPTKLTELPWGADPAAWSPDGNFLAFSAYVDTAASPEPNNSPIAAKAPVVVEEMGYKLDGFGLRRGLRKHVFLIDLAAGGVRQLTHGDRDCSGPLWSPDGAALAYTTHDYKTVGSVLCPEIVGLVSAAGEDHGYLTPSDARLCPVDWSPDGTTLLCIGSDRWGLAEPHLWNVRVEDGRVSELLPNHRSNHMPGWESHLQAHYSPDGTTILFGEWRNARTRLLQVDARGGTPVELVGGDRDVRAARYSDFGVLFIAGDAHSIADLYFDDGTAERRLSDYLSERLPEVTFVQPKVRTFTAPDGRQLQGYVMRRDDVTGPTPVVVDVHGGPYNSWAPRLNEHFLHQQVLAGMGWTVLCVDPRGSASYGEDFMLGSDGNWGFADEGDILAPLDTLIDEGLVDPARQTVTGFSYGGYLSSWLTSRTKRFSAAACGVMICDQVAAQGSDAGSVYSYWAAGGPLWESYDRLRDVSPISRCGDVETPTLILQGEDDLRCPMGQGEQWFQALHSRGVPVQLVRYPDASHFFLLAGSPYQALDVYQRVVDWLLKYVGQPVIDR
ncbi:prolyl oligopeptidase family serine peptidase [Dactylosporangium sp. CA-233914]|uniref:prolyl oligopeptidase family serine peptidase n=1 Tax=Dactylosporangium sp. CA-233914 TaxID=3239934 RepID=UPI003D8A142E